MHPEIRGLCEEHLDETIGYAVRIGVQYLFNPEAPIDVKVNIVEEVAVAYLIGMHEMWTRIGENDKKVQEDFVETIQEMVERGREENKEVIKQYEQDYHE
ncbi:MAG: hypothetical protein ABEI13_00745 [Candidatus Paceibacteria bacterium]